MIGFDEVTGCGTVLRSHGVDGEVVIPVSAQLIEDTGLRFIVLQMDGILVPFFIESFRRRTDSASLVKLEGIDSMEKADSLRGKRVWLLKKEVQEGLEEDYSPEMFIGMLAADRNKGLLGEITGVDDSTANVLFRIENCSGREIIVPASPELIKNVDVRKGEIMFDLPDGLTDL